MRKQTLVFLVMTLLLLLLCACTPKVSPSTTAPAEQTTNSSTVADEQTQIVETQAVSEESTSAVSATTAQPENAAASFTKAEIVEMFNAAANKVKREKPGYVFTTKSNANEKNIVLPDSIPFRDAISKFIASKINETSKDPVTIGKGANHNDFPVKEQTWASKLEPSALKSATCLDKSDYYEIELKFKNERLTALPNIPEQTTHGKAFSVLLDKEFRASFGGFEANLLVVKVSVENKKFEPEYKDSTIKCKVDKAGNMQTATYYLNTASYVEMDVHAGNKNFVLDIQMEYSVTDEYVFN